MIEVRNEVFVEFIGTVSDSLVAVFAVVVCRDVANGKHGRNPRFGKTWLNEFFGNDMQKMAHSVLLLRTHYNGGIGRSMSAVRSRTPSTSLSPSILDLSWALSRLVAEKSIEARKIVSLVIVPLALNFTTKVKQENQTNKFIADKVYRIHKIPGNFLLPRIL